MPDTTIPAAPSTSVAAKPSDLDAIEAISGTELGTDPRTESRTECEAERGAESTAADGSDPAGSPTPRLDGGRSRWTPIRGGVQWPTMSGIVLLHLGALAALLPGTFSWGAAATLPILWWVTGGLGICLGYHRLLTHRSFKTSLAFERFLATLGALCWQGGPLHWVGTHRLHHAESDGELDPHSPQHGFTWAHVLWCFHRRPEGRDPQDVVKDLARDPYMRWLDRWFLLPQIALGLLLYGIGHLATGTVAGAWGYVIWGVCIRTIFCYHATWFVNSAAHTWGYRNFRTRDGSRNTWWVALLSFGEGWHNNHHAQQRSAAHGMRWWEVDPTWWAVLVLERLGVIHGVIRPKLDRLDPHR